MSPRPVFPWGVRGLSGALLLLLMAVAGVVATKAAPQAGCPDVPIPTVSSSKAPADVCIPEGFLDVAMDPFDDFSWRTFIALVWPAAKGQRGVPDAKKTPLDPGPRVFETYKSLWEVFHEDGSAPAAFNTYDAAAHNACHAEAKFGDIVLASFSGIDDIGQAGIGNLDPPLVAQNGKYVRYQTLYNQTEFDHIVKNQYFLRSHLPEVPRPRPLTPVVSFPNGSIAIKAAWVDVAGLAPELVKRFYTRTAVVRDATGPDCHRITVGLVGLHLIQKTPSRPQWIWSSFEQQDNIPPGRPNSPGSYTFNDGTQTPMPVSNPLALVPLAPEPVRPFNVTRPQDSEIHPSTVVMSYKYQELLKGSVWRIYRLVVTQWPRVEGNQATPVPASQDGSVPNTFPGLGAFSAFTNAAMETFDQGRVQLGCMNCHNQVRMTGDFMWTVVNHAYPSQLAPAPAGVHSIASTAH